MGYLEMLEEFEYKKTKIIITTKNRGEFIGIPHSPDECETDEERFGYFIEIGDHMLDTVYLDEIVSICEYDETVLLIPQGNLLHVSSN